MHELNKALAAALGLPRMTTKAVLTLEACRFPTIEITCDVTDSNGRLILDPVLDTDGRTVDQKIRAIQFMVRLEPFSESDR